MLAVMPSASPPPQELKEQVKGELRQPELRRPPSLHTLLMMLRHMLVVVDILIEKSKNGEIEVGKRSIEQFVILVYNTSSCDV